MNYSLKGRCEAPRGIEPLHSCFADSRVSTSPWRQGPLYYKKESPGIKGRLVYYHYAPIA